MKTNTKIVLALIAVWAAATFLVGCGGEDKVPTVSSLGNGQSRYVLLLTLEQEHTSIDLFKHMKDNMNAVEFEMPVDKAYFDSVTEGQQILNVFRDGSLLTEGSVGEWVLTVKGKSVK